MCQRARTTLYCLIQVINNYDFHIFVIGKEEKVIWNSLELFIWQLYFPRTYKSTFFPGFFHCARFLFYIKY